MMVMMNKFFSHVKLVAQYYACQWKGKLINKLYIVSVKKSVFTVRHKLRSSTTEDSTNGDKDYGHRYK